MTPLLQEMLGEMRQTLTKEDIKAGVPDCAFDSDVDASTLYVEWIDLQQRLEKQKSIIDDLDQDILRMSPWADFPMSRIDQLAQSGQSLRFWKAREEVFAKNQQLWTDNYQIELANREDGFCYFVTVTPIETSIVLHEAEEVIVSPSPVSTLLSLQTRAKDTLRRIIVEQGDFAMQHYRVVESALGLTDTLVLPTKRRRLLNRLKRLLNT